MKKSLFFVSAFVLFTLLANCGFALDIQVAPQTLVLSSGGGNLTVHTDVPFDLAETVALDVNGTAVDVSLFADCYGNVVAQCSKEVAKEAVGDFDGKTTTITVTLTVNGDSASEDIRVKK